jgi:putative ABC transport system substrate-binding protein
MGGAMDPERRAFVAFLSAALAMRSIPTNAQQATHLRTVGVLMGLADDAETQARTKAIEQGLAKKGWIVGQNLRIGRMLSFSEELAALRPDVIIGHSTPVVAALLKVTHTIPVVFVLVADPVGSGFVASIARPGGNVTGFTVLAPTITGKYLSILRELKLQLTRVAMMYNPESVPGGGASFLPSFMESAKEFHVTPVAAEVHNLADIEATMADLGAAPGSGLIVMAGNFIADNRELVISLAARYRIPTMYPYRYYADAGGLMSYGIDALDVFRRAAVYVDRILNGEAPGNLPIQAPTKFEFVINLKTAKVLGLSVPRILLAGADALIE